MTDPWAPPQHAELGLSYAKAPESVVPESIVLDSARGWPAGRICQLSYTSFDGRGVGRPRAGGGWQIKETQSGVTEVEQELMREWVSTRFDLVHALPQFPVPADIAKLPRRLLYSELENGQAGYWHTVPAGADASGRPGNVFAHVVLERGPDPDPDPVAADGTSIRPIDRWRSADWLVPYGPEEVLAATLTTSEVPRPGAVVSRERVLDFLLDPGTWRIGVLSLLLDAVAAAMAGGPAVVFGVADADRAALWIGAVSHLMSPGTARTFSWSTYDRRQMIDETVARGVHLIAVPIEDLGDLQDAGGCVVIGEEEESEPGELGLEPHRTARGVAVTATAWSVLAQTVLLDHDTAMSALAEQDRVAVQVGDTGLTPQWPLAMVVASRPELSDGLDEASQVLNMDSPLRVQRYPSLLRIVMVAATPELGQGAETVWQELLRLAAGGGAGTVRFEITFTTLILRALADPAWLGQGWRRYPDGMARTPDADWPSAEVRAAVDGAVRALSARAADPVRTADSSVLLALETLRLLDLAAHTGILVGGAVEEVHRILETVVVPIVVDGARGPDFVASVGQLCARARRDYLQEAVGLAPALRQWPLGQRLHRSVLGWLVDLADPQPTVEQLQADPALVRTGACMLVAELIFQAAGLRDDEIWQPVKSLAGVAAWRALTEAQEGLPVADPALVADRALVGARLVLTLYRAFPELVPARAFINQVSRQNWDASVAEAVQMIKTGEIGAGDARMWALERSSPAAVDKLTFTWACLRGAPDWSAYSPRWLFPMLDTDVANVFSDFAGMGFRELPEDLTANLVLMYVARRAWSSRERADGRAPAELPRLHPAGEQLLIDAALRHEAEIMDGLGRLTANGSLDPYWLVGAAIITAPGAPRVHGAIAQDDLLLRLKVDREGTRVPLVGEFASTVIAAEGYYGPNDQQSALDGVALALDRSRGIDVDNAVGSYRDFATHWIEDRGKGPLAPKSRMPFRR